MKKTIIIIALVTVFSACEKKGSDDGSPAFEYVDRVPIMDTIYEITADFETEPIEASAGSDAADDPAIWIHPDDPSESIIYGSNKKGGIVAYDLSGKKKVYQEPGKINNIDIAYGIQLQNETIDICGGTNRSINAIDIYRIDPGTGELEYVLDVAPASSVDEVYGFCFYHSPYTATNYAILCGKDGVVEQYEILEGGEKLSLKLVNSFDIGSQPEGMVADHKHGYLYIGEENECIWKVSAEPGASDLTRIDHTSESNNNNIEYDIEGLTIYYTSSENGYLIASSQGNDSYAIYDRFYGNEYIGSFSIVDGVVDGTSDTDGIDVVNISLGSNYPNGMFIAQDDRNVTDGITEPQNFKMVDWQKVSGLFNPPLYIDNSFNIRELFARPVAL